jgi:hypothetical protein
MELHLNEAVNLLQRTPQAVSAILGGAPDSWQNSREGPETFSPVDVVGHLIYGEQVDWLPRVRIILECGETKPFEPFDRFGFHDLVQEKGIEDLLDTFAALRRKNLDSLAELRLDSEKLALTGAHPGLGRVTMSQLLAAWVVHDLGHINQIVRVMARQYGEAVGPWRAYLSILG